MKRLRNPVQIRKEAESRGKPTGWEPLEEPSLLDEPVQPEPVESPPILVLEDEIDVPLMPLPPLPKPKRRPPPLPGK